MSLGEFLLKNPLPWIAVLVLSSLFLISNSGCGFVYMLLATWVLILSSTFIFTSSKEKAHVLEGSMKEEEVFRSKQEDSDLLVMDEVVLNPEHHPESDQTTTKRKELQENERCQIRDYFLSESESLGHSWTSEDFEVDWPYFGNAGHHSPACSDDSISDDDSLIEIALPDGHFVGHKEEEEEEEEEEQQEQEQEDDDDVKPCLLHNKLPEFAPESIFRQQSLMELLAEINEMNEEENLIEIDISMGSIKCSRFEIEA